MENNGNNEVQRLLLKENLKLEEMAAFGTLHKAGFRIAFDFLQACFPPNRSEDYWKATVERMRDLDNSNHNLLAQHLLIGVYGYLEEMVKDLKEEDGNEGNETYDPGE